MRIRTVTMLVTVGLSLAGQQVSGWGQEPTATVAPRSERVLRPQPSNASRPRLADASGFLPARSQSPPMPIAIGGFCIVSLHDQEEWVRGEEEIQARFDGQRYHFTDFRQRDIFAASPERYVPMLKGDCPVTLVETGERVAGSLAFGLVHRNRVLFFRGHEQLEAFRSDPGRYAGADLANDGYCLVSQQLDKKQVLGMPQAMAIFDGQRYLFANAHKQRIFASNPSYFVGVPPSAGRSASSPSEREGASSEGGFPPDVLDDSDLPLPDHAERADLGTKPPYGGGLSGADRTASDDLHRSGIYRGTQAPVMSGYCVVSIRKHGLWVRGKSTHFLNYNDRVYFFAGPDELQSFQQDSQSYDPVLSGDCVVAYHDRNVRDPGSPFFSLEFQGRLYLFVDQESKEKFLGHLVEYEHADLAFQGNCVVTQAREGKQVNGSSEWETRFHGKRYRFASRELMESFLENPLSFEVP